MTAKVIVADPQELADLVRGVVRDELRRAAADELLDAKASGLGITTFRRLVREKKLTATKSGRRYLVRRAELERCLAERHAEQHAAKPAQQPERDPLQDLLDAGRLRVVPSK